MSLITRFYWTAYLAGHVRGQAGFSERTEDEVRLDVQFVDAIDRTANGKSRTLVSLVRGRAAAEPSGESSDAETNAEPAS